MGDPTGFLKVERQDRTYRPAEERVQHYKEFVIDRDPAQSRAQASRCMDCGIPFCHSGCPVNNLIPDWNDLVYKDDWKTAIDRLHETNNFPEFTGRVCPAPCEASCTLNLEDIPVTIKSIECEIADRAFDEGWVKPQLSPRGTGKRIAIVGSGPAGLACAQQLARHGHNPTVFEKSDRIGGLLRYGIPDFKMEKQLIDRRVAQMEAEGVLFRTGLNVGLDIPVERLMDDYDILVLAGGAEKPRDLEVPGRDLEGTYFAMEFLTQQNKRNAGDPEEKAAGNRTLSAAGKHVIVIGGGDTGSDCIGTSHRQGALSVTQLEIMPEPPVKENKLLTWPHWPMKLRTSSSQEEGADREFAIITKELIGEDGKVTALVCEQNGERVELKADLVLLAMGFVGPCIPGAVEQTGVDLTDRGNVDAAFGEFRTSNPRIFACGDMRRGQSLVVWAIREGRDCARSIHAQLSAATRQAA